MDDIGPVLLVTPWYRPTIGGVAEVTERLRGLLCGAGVQTFVWVCSDTSAVAEGHDQLPSWLRYRYVPSSVFHGANLRSIVATLVHAPAALLDAYNFLRKHRIRTVILLYPMGYAWPFLILRSLRFIHLISSCHGNEILKFATSSRLARWLFSRVLYNSDAITVPAAHLPERAKEIAPRRPLPIWIIPNCVNEEFFVPRPRGSPKADRPTFIHISAFTPRKRTLDIVTAFSLARLPPNSRLLMVGAGPELASAKELARTLGVSDRVEFVGAPPDVRPYLWQSDVHVMASDEESGPITLLEAMACEVPWIMTPWGIAMTLERGQYGIIVPGRVPEKMAEAMEDILKEPERLRTMGVRGRQKVVKEFSQARYLERHMTLIHAVKSGTAYAGIDYSASSTATSDQAQEVKESEPTT